MAKDPAFLFYSSDFMMGTALMSETEVGQYIRILCHMHQSGHLSIEDMKNICPYISSKVVAKFKQDDNGLYFNERLEAEVQKRKNYSKSRRENRLKNKKQSYDNTYVPDMSGHMENENENTIVIDYKEGVQGKETHTVPIKLESKTIVEDDTLQDVTHWTEQVIKGNDQIFSQLLSTRSIKINGAIEKLARDHLDLCSRYNWHERMTSQQAFRNSLIKHVTENINKNGQQAKGILRTTSAQVGGTDYTGGLGKK